MANIDLERTVKSTADLSDKNYRIMAQDPSNDRNVLVANAQTAQAVGVLQLGDKAGRPCKLRFHGVSKVMAGAAFAAGSRLTADSQGRAIATTTANDYVIGIAIEAATAAGDIVEMQLTHFKI